MSEVLLDSREDSFQERIKKDVTCALCLNLFLEPKSLPSCSHSFCADCVKKLLTVNRSDSHIECPICRVKSSLTHGNHLASIPTNYHLKSVADQIRERDARTTGNSSFGSKGSPKSLRHDSTVSVTPKDGIHAPGSTGSPKSLRHDSTISITSKGDSFMAHLARKAHGDLKLLAGPLDKAHNSVLTALDTIKATQEEMQLMHAVNRDELKNHFSGLRALLDKQEKTAVSKLNEINTNSLKVLAHQRTELNDWSKEIHSAKMKVASLLGSMDHDNVVGITSRVEERALDLCAMVETANLEPQCMPSTTVLYTGHDKLCDTFCRVYATPHPTNCAVVDHTKDVIPAIEPIIITVRLADAYGNPVLEQAEHIKIRSRTEENFIVETNVRELTSEEGLYRISYYPKSRYEHSIDISHQAIQISVVDIPSLVVCDYNMKKHEPILSYGPRNTKFNRPSSLALGPNEEIVVSDRGSHKLIVFDKDRKFKHTISQKFSWPSGFVISSDGHVYLADRKHHCIQKLELMTGRFVLKFGKRGGGSCEFNEPISVCLSSNNQLFVADSLNHRIQVFNKEGKFLFSFGRSGSDPGEFNFPCSLALNRSEDQVLISDNRNHRVQVFTARGVFLQLFGDQTDNPLAVMQFPCGLYRTRDGHVLVCSAGTSSLLVFKEDGSFVNAIKEGLDEPGNVVMNAKGELITCNHYSIVVSHP